MSIVTTICAHGDCLGWLQKCLRQHWLDPLLSTHHFWYCSQFSVRRSLRWVLPKSCIPENRSKKLWLKLLVLSGIARICRVVGPTRGVGVGAFYPHVQSVEALRLLALHFASKNTDTHTRLSRHLHYQIHLLFQNSYLRSVLVCKHGHFVCACGILLNLM